MKNQLFNPDKHHRKSIRKKGFDYSREGLYFITICCQDKICRFGNVVNGKMILNEYGTVAFNEWLKLSERFSNFELDAFQIMPNHMHGIIFLTNVRATLAVAQNDDGAHNDRDTIGAGASPAPTVSDIVGAYKSLVANGCLDIYKSKNKMMGKLWQRNYWENIIRNENAYYRILNYIINNPANWNKDKFNRK